MDWNDPAQRAHLALQLGPKAYNEAFAKHVKDSTVAIVNGHRIRPIGTQFGQLYQIGQTGLAHPDLERARAIAGEQPPGTDSDD